MGKKLFNIDRINKIKSFIVRYISTNESYRKNIFYIYDQIAYISEICLNVFNFNISIEKDLRKKLDRVKSFMKKLSFIKKLSSIKIYKKSKSKVFKCFKYKCGYV